MKLRRVTLVLVALWVWIGTCEDIVYAQSTPIKWREPVVLVPEEGLFVDQPRLFTTDTGKVILLFTKGKSASDQPGDVVVFDIYCMQLEGTQWSSPVDVIVSPSQMNSRYIEGAIDSSGNLHLVWTGGAGTPLYYSQAPVDGACSASTWSAPSIISDERVLRGAVATDGEDRVHVLYSVLGGDIHYTMSEDGGAVWGYPVNVSNVTPDIATDKPRVAVGEDGRIHGVWSEVTLPNGTPSVGLFYANSIDNGKTWSTPLQIAGPEGNEPAVMVAENNTHLVWNGRVGTGGRYHQWSADGGESWSPVSEVVGRGIGGSTSAPGLAVDREGNLHFVSGLAEETGPVVHAIWNGSSWTAPRPISGDWRFAEQAQIVFDDQNNPHVVFVVYRGIESTMLLDVSSTNSTLEAGQFQPTPAENQIKVAPVNTATMTSTGSITTATLTEVQTIDPADASAPLNSVNTSSNTVPIATAVIPVLVLLAIVIFVNQNRRQR